MFTGLVETTGKLRGRERRGPGFRLRIATELGPLELGESIAVSGACLTVVEHDASGFSADVSVETAEKTTLGRIGIGSAVNLERSLRLGDRLGGHLVTGHVDAVARVSSADPVGDALRVGVTIPAELAAFVAAKGSVTLDGVSLTVNERLPQGFEVMLIPHTREVTNLGAVRPGLEMNLEVDLLARYVVGYLTHARETPGLKAALENAGIL
jgi:riboflavin synthase